MTETLNVDASHLSVVKNSQHASKDGRHFAFVLQKGDRQAPVVDGVVGMEYAGELIALNFSPNNQRVSYYLLTDNKRKWQAVVDGQAGPVYDDISDLSFSPDSKRVGFVGQRAGRLVPVIDGVEGKSYTLGTDEDGMPDIAFSWLEFSPDSKRVACQVEDGHQQVIWWTGSRWVATPTRAAPSFSPDSQHIIYPAKRNDKWVLVKDGVEGPEYDEIETISEHFSNDSQRVSYVGKRGDKWVGVVDGLATPEYDRFYRINFSPDSKRTCYAGHRGDKQFPVVDGVEGKEYDEIEHISFSPDSKRVEFPAKRNGKWVKVIDGVESAEYDSDGFGPTFSPNSKRVAYTGQRGEKQLAVVDGIEGLPYDNVQPLVFSPDSKHVAYWAKRGEQWILVIDGAEVKAWDGFVAQPIFDSGAALHTLVIADSSVLLATVQISKGGAMVQRTLPAAAPKPRRNRPAGPRSRRPCTSATTCITVNLCAR